MLDLDCRVLKLLHRSPEPLKVGDIAMALDIPHSTIGSCVKRLKDEDYVEYRAYNVARLTDAGRDLAIELIRHSQLMEVLLFHELGLTAELAHQESEKLNLLFSCEVINKICEKYDHPDKCPCGDLILSSFECYCEKKH